MFSSGLQAYESCAKATTSSRELEAAALFKAARNFEVCRQQWDAEDRAARLDEALRYNLRLWTLFQSELARSDHELPVELRVSLLRLSAFIDRRTFELMAQPDRDRLQVLIDVNRHVASGLSTESR